MTPLVVVMGVSGSGKSTVGAALAARLGVVFGDADNLHSPANVAKMRAGVPLTDDDRRPWLDAVGAWLAVHAGEGGVIACSALKRRYRDRLRAYADPTFVLLTAPRPVLERRLAGRRGHFMPAGLLASQLAALEPLQPDEHGFVVDVGGAVEAAVADCLAQLR